MSDQPSDLITAARHLRLLLYAYGGASDLDADDLDERDPHELAAIIVAFCMVTRALIGRYHVALASPQLREDIEALGSMAAEMGSEYASAWARVREWLQELEKDTQ